MTTEFDIKMPLMTKFDCSKKLLKIFNWFLNADDENVKKEI